MHPMFKLWGSYMLHSRVLNTNDLRQAVVMEKESFLASIIPLVERVLRRYYVLPVIALDVVRHGIPVHLLRVA